MTLAPSLALSLALGLACGDKDDDTGTDGDGGGSGDGGSDDGGSADGGSGDGGSADGGSGDGGSGDGGSGDGGGSADTARVRVVHGSPNAPSVDVWVAGLDAPVITDLAYGEASGYLEVAAGAYEFLVKAHPSTADDAAVYSTGSLDVPADATITAAAWGELGVTGPTAFTVTPFVEDWGPVETGTFRARIVHASPDAPAVDLDVGNDGTAEITGFAYGTDSDALVPGGVPLPAGAPTAVGIWAGGQRVTSFTIPALPEGTEVFVFADGYLSDAARTDTGFLLLAVPQEGGALAIRQDPRIYALHGSPNAPAVDVFAGPAELISDLAFGELAGPLQVPPGSYTLDFFGTTGGTTRPGGSPAASASTGNLEAGETYLAMANGFLGGSPAFELLAWSEAFALDDSANVRARIVHGSPDAPAVEVGPVSGGAVSSLGLLAYGEDSGAEGLSLPPDNYTIGLALEGTTAPVLSFDLDLRGAAGVRAFAIAAGSLGDPDSEAFRLLIVDTSASPWAVAEVWPN